MCGGGGRGEALDRLVADAEGGAAFGVHFYEAGAGIGVRGHRRRDWDFVDGFVGADGEALEGEVKELGVCGELGWNWTKALEGNLCYTAITTRRVRCR